MSTSVEHTTRFTEADFDGYNAAPLLIVGREQQQYLIDRQDKLAENFMQLAHERLDGLVDLEVSDFVAASIRNRMQQREGQNGMAYSNRLSVEPNPSLVDCATEAEVHEACELAKVGQARLAQHAISAAAWEMYAWEGENLTIVDTFRKELEAPMWDETTAFSGVEASPSFAAMRGFRVNQFIGGETRKNPARAMRVEMKRTINEAADGTLLKARTAAIINTAHPYIDPRSIRSIYAAYRANIDMSTHPEFLEVAEQLVDNALPTGVVLARNETVYGYKPETEERFKQERARKAAISDARSNAL